MCEGRNWGEYVDRLYPLECLGVNPEIADNPCQLYEYWKPNKFEEPVIKLIQFLSKDLNDGRECENSEKVAYFYLISYKAWLKELVDGWSISISGGFDYRWYQLSSEKPSKYAEVQSLIQKVVLDGRSVVIRTDDFHLDDKGYAKTKSLTDFFLFILNGEFGDARKEIGRNNVANKNNKLLSNIGDAVVRNSMLVDGVVNKFKYAVGYDICQLVYMALYGLNGQDIAQVTVKDNERIIYENEDYGSLPGAFLSVLNLLRNKRGRNTVEKLFETFTKISQQTDEELKYCDNLRDVDFARLFDMGGIARLHRMQAVRDFDSENNFIVNVLAKTECRSRNEVSDKGTVSASTSIEWLFLPIFYAQFCLVSEKRFPRWRAVNKISEDHARDIYTDFIAFFKEKLSHFDIEEIGRSQLGQSLDKHDSVMFNPKGRRHWSKEFYEHLLNDWLNFQGESGEFVETCFKHPVFNWIPKGGDKVRVLKYFVVKINRLDIGKQSKHIARCIAEVKNNRILETES